MSNPVGELSVAVTADTRLLAQQVQTGASKAGTKGADSMAKSMRTRIGSLAKSVVGPLTGAFAAIKVGAFFKDTILSAEAATTANNRLAETLKNAGDETGRYAERQSELAEAISKATGYHDEEIKAGQAILATFHEVSASAGEVGGSFDRATQAGVDLAAAGFGSIEGNATQLGKALNDPIQGMSALTRVGVSFTAEQKNLIESFMETNDVAAAQDVILDAVESQVEGTAVASADASDKMAVGWQNVKESIGETLMPAFQGLVDYMIETALPKIEELVGWVKDELVPRFKEWGGWLSENKSMLMGLTGTVLSAIGAFYLINGVMKAWQAFRAVLLLVRSGLLLTTIAQWLLNAAMLANPVGIIVAAIAVLIGALVALYHNNETVRDFIDEAWAKIKEVVGTVVDAIVDFWNNTLKPAWDDLVDFVRDTLWPILQDVFDKISDAWDTLVTGIEWFWKNVLKPVWDKLVAAAEWVWSVLQVIFDVIAVAWEIAMLAIQWYWNNVLKPVWDAIRTAAEWLWNNVLKPVFDKISDAWDTALSAMERVWNNVLKPVFDAIKGWLEDKLGPAFAKAKDAISRAWDGVKSAVMAPIDFVVTTVLNNGIIKAINWVAEKLGAEGRVARIPWPPGGSNRPDHLGGGRAAMGGFDFDLAAIGKVLTNPAGWLRDQVSNLLSGIGDSPVAQIIGNAPMKAIDWFVNWIKDKIGLGESGSLGRAGRVMRAGTYRIGMPFLGYPGHYGADYPAATGTPVYSPYPGIVTRALSLATSYGRHVFITHPGGIVTRYAHLSSYAVRPGQPVQPGQQIGRVGSTGNSTGPHLHFEYLRNGMAMNPATLGLFDKGGLLAHGGLAMNLSGKPERILTPKQTEALRTLQIPLAQGEAGQGVAVVNVYVGNEKLDSRIDYRVRQTGGDLAGAGMTGRRGYGL